MKKRKSSGFLFLTMFVFSLCFANPSESCTATVNCPGSTVNLLCEAVLGGTCSQGSNWVNCNGVQMDCPDPDQQ